MSITPGPSDRPAPPPPAGEEIHLPGPTILPFVTAIAITSIVIGTTLGWWLSIVGGVVFIVVVVRWIRDTRRDIAALPEQHP
jgi:Flp pilus assembly protein TadB